MSKAKKWEIMHKLIDSKATVVEVITLLLENRGITTKKEQENFLYPRLEEVIPKNVGIDRKQLTKALARIKKAIEKKEQIVIFGDYDVDGITGSAILWETLYGLGATCVPYIPNRKGEGYGLSKIGISNLKEQVANVNLIITVDNGIVANDAVSFANEQGIDVIITDHHTVSEKLPDAYAIVHTTKLCGAGVAYLLSKEIKGFTDKITEDNHLELAALGTVADLVPLTGANRAIVTAGLKKLQETKRPGLLALFQIAKIAQDSIGVYEIGYIIGPRLNASGRIESAMDSLRLLCTLNKERAADLAAKLELVNRERQQLLKEAAEHAILGIREVGLGTKKILIVGHTSYEEGVIGLVAGKLVEAFYRPAIVLSLGKTVSKASVRSVSGFDIIAFLRMYKEHFVNVGGHPMAAGFTIETAKIEILQKRLEEKAETLLTEALLRRTLKIDCELSLTVLNKKLYEKMQQLAPFGMANPEPVFVSRDVTVSSFRIIGKERNHLRLVLQQDGTTFEAIAFGMGELADTLKSGDTIDIAYVLDENTWNGNTKLQLKMKDIVTRLN
ncbi:MAG TPA: single-stranded-DNA-specific exonuclease RecJ [Candidatus Sulfotelmatobacter sp.]|nr:single-stranded-DNA-specific exonuclease RecJ [Candidatus Sulfotelmatobacter sp.]